MLKSITWGLYLEGLSIIIPAYYLIILTVYYRQDFSRWFNQKRREKKAGVVLRGAHLTDEPLPEKINTDTSKEADTLNHLNDHNAIVNP